MTPTPNKLTKARTGLYLTGLAGLVGLALATLGYADFDMATGVIDVKPFNVYTLVAGLPAVVALVIAPIAAVLGWGRK